ncbi:hypothetical protein IWQ60_006805 [Tieghemiomyces parasiticus]|uniref:Zinc finger C2H2 LYAR-type domain-containing protein n=1 Tax=Tieghemiomyces parasiticus TaxID=78921 RepID=A0A9W8A2U7_9FUNG|nr:hypothetical protein IWQ60_006805 [Tieghemiomyces parasiticus]
MAHFICDVCQAVLPQSTLQKHLKRCRRVRFSCLGCRTDLLGDDYLHHNRCFTPEEKAAYETKNTNLYPSAADIKKESTAGDSPAVPYNKAPAVGNLIGQPTLTLPGSHDSTPKTMEPPQPDRTLPTKRGASPLRSKSPIKSVRRDNLSPARARRESTSSDSSSESSDASASSDSSSESSDASTSSDSSSESVDSSKSSHTAPIRRNTITKDSRPTVRTLHDAKSKAAFEMSSVRGVDNWSPTGHLGTDVVRCLKSVIPLFDGPFNIPELIEKARNILLEQPNCKYTAREIEFWIKGSLELKRTVNGYAIFTPSSSQPQIPQQTYSQVSSIFAQPGVFGDDD